MGVRGRLDKMNKIQLREVFVLFDNEDDKYLLVEIAKLGDGYAIAELAK